jgi:hypothetical protein
MKDYLMIFIFIMVSSSTLLPNVLIYKDLSDKYFYEINTFIQKEKDGDLEKIYEIQVKIINKSDTTNFQKITIKPDWLNGDAYTNTSEASSYLIGKNKKREIFDNDFGDFIVADFNFDALEDFAVKRCSGGNGGPLYEYFIQDSTGVFHKDIFLTNEVAFFPSEIDENNKLLKTYVHANVYGVNEHIYKYDTVKMKWTYLQCNELWKKELK